METNEQDGAGLQGGAGRVDGADVMVESGRTGVCRRDELPKKINRAVGTSVKQRGSRLF